MKQYRSLTLIRARDKERIEKEREAELQRDLDRSYETGRRILDRIVPLIDEDEA